MKSFEFALFIIMMITSIALVLSSIKIIKTIKANPDKRVEEIESRLRKDLTAVTILFIADAVLIIANIIIK